MANRMSDIEIKAHLQKLQLVAQVAMGIPAAELLETYSHYNAIVPILYPSEWMEASDNTQANEQMVRALATFQKAIGEHWPALIALLEAEA